MGESSVVVHNFIESLERSWDLSEDLDALYYQCFPHLAEITLVTDKELQKAGVDKILTLSNGKQIYVDEKVREKDYGDFLLEEYSNLEARRVGWLGRDKLTDYIVYAIKPTRTAYLLPFLLLQRAWVAHYSEWKDLYEVEPADNGTYHTSNLAIPKEVLFEALTEAACLPDETNGES